MSESTTETRSDWLGNPVNDENGNPKEFTTKE